MKIIVPIITSFVMCAAVAGAPDAQKTAIFPNQKEKVYFPEVDASLFPYEEETYVLAYKTYISKRELKSAYIVAFAAVKQKPDSKIWRERLATVSIWYGKPRMALDQYLALIFNFHDKNYLNLALDLADKLNALPILEKLWDYRLSLGPLTPEEKYRYAALKERIGKVHESVDLYSEIFEKTKKPEDLLRVAEMEYALGNVAHAKALLQQLAKADDVQEAVVLKLAQIFYQQSDYPEALKTLKLILENPKPKTHLYWMTLGEIAWSLEDNKTAKIALEHLVKEPKVTTDDLYRMALLLQKSNRKRAAYFAKLAWDRNNTLILFMFLVDSFSEQKDWNSFKNLLRDAPSNILKEASAQAYFWEVKLLYYLSTDQLMLASENYQKAIAKFPNNVNLKIGFLNLSIKTKNWSDFLRYAELWKHQLEHKTEYNDALRNYLDEMGKKRNTIPIWLSQFEKEQKNPFWLYDLTDDLELLGYKFEAQVIQQALWNWIQRIRWQNNAEKTQLFAQLALKRSRGDTLWQAAVYNLDKKTPLAKDIAISTALSQNNFPTAIFLNNHWYASPRLVPDWAQLTIALHQEDRSTMDRLLRHPSSLPIRDRVTAAIKLGDIAYAKKLAYEGMVQDPRDMKLYHIFTDLMVETSNYHKFDISNYNVGTFGGPELQWENRTAYDNTWYFIPQIKYWRLTLFDNSQMLRIPPDLAQFRLTIKNKNRYGFNSLRAAANQAWKNYFGATWTSEYLLHHDLTATLKLEAHEPSEDTNALMVVGMQNFADLSLNFKLSPTNTLELRGGAGDIEDQVNEYLSGKYLVSATWTHRLISIDSNLTIAPLIEGDWFPSTAVLPLDLLQFIPPTQATNISFYVPQNFYQYGIRFAWDDEWRFAYRERWRPYFSVEFLNNSVSNFGYDIEGGFSGSVFGRDNLKFYALASKNTTGQQNQQVLQYGLKYTFYLNSI